MGFQYFIGISRSHIDFKISMRFHRISRGSHSDLQDLPNFNTTMIVIWMIADIHKEVATKMD